MDLVVLTAFALASVSFLTSCALVVIVYAKRDDNPVIAPLQQQIDALRLGQTDIIDRVDQWTKRDRTRRLREAAANDVPEAQPAVAAAPPDPKAALRSVARERGITR